MIESARQLLNRMNHPYPQLFITLSGAHLYGFPSRDSDYDLRGVHILPLKDLVGLNIGPETVDVSQVHQGLEVDLVTHDAGKFFKLLLKKNGYVLEQLYSPLIVRSSPEHKELKTIVRGCLTKNHAYHYLGFARNQRQIFLKESPPRLKRLLYIYRVLLTGLHLMAVGRIEADLTRLNEDFKLPYLSDLVRQKIEGREKMTFSAAKMDFHQREFDRLTSELEAARDRSFLPENPSAEEELNDLLIRIRLGKIGHLGP